MILIFFAAALSAILPYTPSEYQELADKAKKAICANTNSPPMAKPGFYNLNGLSFNLQSYLLNNKSLELYGSAFENGVLAIVPNRNLLDQKRLESLENVVYIDIDSQDVFKLSNTISDDGVVMILNCVQVNPFDVFTEVNMETAEGSDANGPSYQCEKDNSLGVRCKAEYGYDWETPEGMQDGFDLRALEMPTEIPGLSAYHGFYARGFASAGVKIHSIKNIEILTGFEAGIAAGLGFRFEKKVGPASILDKGIKYPLYGYSKNFYGFKFGFEIDLLATVSLRDITLEFPEELYYYKQAMASLSVVGHLQIKDGVTFDSPNFTFKTETDTNLNNFSIKDYVQNTRVLVTPEFNLGLEMQLNCGRSTLNIQGAGRFGMHWNFTGDFDKCSVPWLYGNDDAFIQAVYDNSDFKVLGIKVIPEFEKDWTLWESQKTDDHCFFGEKEDQNAVQKGRDLYTEIAQYRPPEQKKEDVKFALSTPMIVVIALGCVILALVAALIVLGVQNSKLKKDVKISSLLLDSESTKTISSKTFPEF